MRCDKKMRGLEIAEIKKENLIKRRKKRDKERMRKEKKRENGSKER